MPFRRTRYPSLKVPFGQVSLSDPLAAGLVGFWPLGAEGGAIDASGRNRITPTVTGTPTWVGGPRGSQLKLDGSSNVAVGYPTPITTNTLTVSVWVTPGVLSRGDVVTVWNSGGPDSVFNLLYGLTSGYPEFFVVPVPGGPASSGTGSGGAGKAMVVGSQYHLCGVYDGTTTYIYLNGVLSSSSTVNFTLPTTGLVSLIFGNNTAGDGAYTGALENVGLWNRALSQSEIGQIFNAPTRPIFSAGRRIVASPASASLGLRSQIYPAWQPADPLPMQSRPMQIVSVDRPPLGGYMAQQAKALPIQLAWVPPDPSPFEGNTQPLAPRVLSAQITAVPVNNPPVGGYLPQQVEALPIQSAWIPADPAPWQKRPAQIVSVDNPPVGGYAVQQPDYGAILVSWIPPDPAPFEGRTQPLAPRVLPAAITSVPVNNPPTMGIWPWLSATLTTWVPPDPTPTLAGKLAPAISAVPVNNPPPRISQPPIVLPIQDPLPQQRGTFVVQPAAAAAATQPAALWPWLPTALSGWITTDPLPSLPRRLLASVTAVPVNNPPGVDLSIQAALMRGAWETIAPLPQVGQRMVPPTAVAVASQPATPFPWLGTVLSSWQDAAPAPVQRRSNLVVSVDPPPIRVFGWVQSIPWAWQAPDPAPTLRRPARTESVDNPPAYRIGPFLSVLGAWVPPDPAPTTRRPAQIQSVDQPPPRNTSLQSIPWSWQTPDPPPTRPGRPGAGSQILSVDRPPIRGGFWLPGVLGAWQQPDPPQQRIGYVSSFLYIQTPADKPPPNNRTWVMPSVVASWIPPDPPPTIRGYRASFIIPATNLVPRRGRFVFLQPDIRAAIISPDIRAVLVPPDEPGFPMDPVNIPPLYWTAAGPNDTDWYFLLLDIWLPMVGDTVMSPTVSITTITGDLTPPSASNVSVDTGITTLTIPPGIPYVSNGPRIKMQIVGGTIGNTYSTVVGWQDAQGRTIYRTVLLPIEAR